MVCKHFCNSTLQIRSAYFKLRLKINLSEQQSESTIFLKEPKMESDFANPQFDQTIDHKRYNFWCFSPEQNDLVNVLSHWMIWCS